ncbi:LuxR C-terminal-related transcriptional regulator [Microbacterium sp. 22242]|uniref:LuxR C-terminal-related transcriptional regulator n=1 Tax=Microbacterium sp. 22242 TaxID=3453896 RepID=UPI003F828CB7
MFRATPDDGDLAAAPHVRAAVTVACGNDPVATAETLAALTGEQRGGSRCLPDPLPLVPAITRAAAQAMPGGADPDALLLLALCGRGPVAALCVIAGRAADLVALSPLAQCVEFTAGRFRFADPVLRAHVVGAAAEAERLAAHQRLAAVLADAGEDDDALWHRARGAVLKDPVLVEPLLVRARAAMRAGGARAAWVLAREAVDHAEAGAPSHRQALLCAGRAALACGFVADALELLEPALRADEPHRAEATAAFVLAHALRHGTAPAPEPLIPPDAVHPGYRDAAVLAAALSAERGDRERCAAWLGVEARIEGDPDARAALLAWCGALAGTGEGERIGGGDVIERVVQALGFGLDGEPDAGVRALAEPAAAEPGEPVAGLHERSPLLRARHAVSEVLLHVWGGRIAVARQLLETAAAELPVALPFAGIALPLARRLELAVDGRTGALSRDLAAAVPWPQRPDGFVERAIEAYLHGRSDEAAVHLQLWADCGRPGEALGLPGIDEIGPLGGPAAPEPPEATAARSLRERIRSAREASWRTDLGSAAAESRAIRSPFERARIEALLGSTYAARGDRAAALRHLRAARSLFDESGAQAWRRLVQQRLRRLGEDLRAERTSPVREPASAAPLEVCRASWEPILTARELEVALLMAEGRTNREIALALHVSVRTVEVHGGRIFAKLDVRTRHELTVLAHRVDQHL